MKKLYKLCAVLMLGLLGMAPGMDLSAQTNFALTATAAHSSGGAAPDYGPALYNNGVIPVFGTAGTGVWGWVTSNGWIEYTWATPQPIAEVIFHNGTTGRIFTSLNIEYFNGTTYVPIVTGVTSSNAPEVTVVFPSPVTTTKLRFNNIAGSNPNFREIQARGTNTPCNDPTIVFPTTAVADADPDTLCQGVVNLSLTTAMPAASGITYQWQSAPAAAGPWTDIGAPQAASTLSLTSVVSTTYFRCQIYCNGNLQLTSSSKLVVTINPTPPAVTGGSRCGPGTVSLSASSVPGAAISWYDAPTGGAPIGTGSPFTTPFISNTTNFYAAASVGNTADSVAVPLASGNTTGVYHHMFLVSATNSITVTGIGIKCNNAVGTATSWDVYYRPDNYQLVAGANTSAAGWTLLSTVTNVPSAGTGAYTEISTTPLSIPAGSTYSLYVAPVGSSTHQYYSPALGTVASSNADASLIAGNRGSALFNCTTSGGMATVKLKYNKGCESPRVPVTATITPGPAFAVSNPAVVCNESTATFTVSSPVANYTSYVWSPVADLYTDAAASIPYTGSSATTVYFKSAAAGPHQFTVFATNTTGAQCTALDTVDVWVQPGNVSIVGEPDTICVSDSSKLTLSPGADYAPGSLQWEQSSNGTTYLPIPGANAVSYTTPIHSSEHYYRVRINSDAGFCLTPVKHLLIADPMVLSTTDSFHCGPGQVVLAATASANTEIRWYEDEEGGVPVATGSPFTTPYLTETDTFYVAAGTGSGGSGADTAMVPLSLGTTTGVYHHMFRVDAINEVNLKGIAIKCNNTVGTMTAWDIYYRPNNYTLTAGSNTSAAGWTLLASVSNVPSAGATTYTQITSNLNLNIPAGATYSFYIAPAAGTTHQYASSALGTLTGSNTDLEIRAGHRGSALFNCSTSGGMAVVRLNYAMSGCETPRIPVIASIGVTPDVDLGADVNQCIDENLAFVLDAGVQPPNSTFLWDDGTTSQVRAVDASGVYHVTVTNSIGCVERDTVSLTLLTNPQVDLGIDTTICTDVKLLLDAGNPGMDHFWSTGATTQTYLVTDPGTYGVTVTSDEGCISTDSITVTMSGLMPKSDGIFVSNDGQYTYKFNLVNPQNAIAFEWDFGDGGFSYEQSPTYTYDTEGIYLVKVTLYSTCGVFVDTQSANIVSVEPLVVDKNAFSIYPNPTRDQVYIQHTGSLKMQFITLYNTLGQVVYRAPADDQKKHTLHLSTLASGMYHVQIMTDKGMLSKKVELIK
jgi:hypothetical protein